MIQSAQLFGHYPLIDECIHWYDHDRIKQSLGWMSPVQYRLSHELAA